MHTYKTLKIARSLIVVALVVSVLALAGQTARAEDAQWRARFWNNKDFSGNPVVERQDSSINFDWGQGSPAAGVSDDNFSAKWNRRVNFAPGTYRFNATMDDGMRVYLDHNVIIDSWADSQAHTMTKDVYVSGGEHDIKVEYYEAGGNAVAKVNWDLVHPEGATVGTGGGDFYPNWKGEYFNNTSLSGAPALVRDDRYLNQNWGEGSPAPGVISNDNWSARWTKVMSGNPGQYNIVLTSDDGARLYVNNVLQIDNWGVHAATTKTSSFNYTGGPVVVRVEYFDQAGDANIDVHLASLSGGGGSQPLIPAEQVSTSTSSGSCGPLAGSIAYVTAQSLNFRDGPSTAFPIVKTLPRCASVELTGYRNPVGSNAGDWVQAVLLDSGQVVWASADYLQTLLNVGQMTVLSD
jgi:hypothetical protein